MNNQNNYQYPLPFQPNANRLVFFNGGLVNPRLPVVNPCAVPVFPPYTTSPVFPVNQMVMQPQPHRFPVVQSFHAGQILQNPATLNFSHHMPLQIPYNAPPNRYGVPQISTIHNPLTESSPQRFFQPNEPLFSAQQKKEIGECSPRPPVELDIATTSMPPLPPPSSPKESPHHSEKEQLLTERDATSNSVEIARNSSSQEDIRITSQKEIEDQLYNIGIIRDEQQLSTTTEDTHKRKFSADGTDVLSPNKKKKDPDESVQKLKNQDSPTTTLQSKNKKRKKRKRYENMHISSVDYILNNNQ